MHVLTVQNQFVTDPAHRTAKKYIVKFAEPRYRLMINVIDK